jgi:hypothetical protein
MAAGQRRPRSKGPYTIQPLNAAAVVTDTLTGAQSQPYTSTEAAYLRDWLTVRAAGYIDQRRAPVYR